MSIKVHIQPIFSDNYVFIIENQGECAIVDPGEFSTVDDKIQSLKLKPKYIFNTHHHWDHVDGNIELKQKYDLKIYCSEYDQSRIPGADQSLKSGDQVTLGDCSFEIIDLPGHTLGHIAYYNAQNGLLFSGDTLFSLGCGRLFEGTAEQLYNSLTKLKSLPKETQIFCTHEYTLHNGEFAKSHGLDNQDMQLYLDEVKKLRAHKLPSIPTTLANELACNPFLLAKNLESFTQLRKLRDKF